MADEEVVGSKQEEILGHAVSMTTSTNSNQILNETIKAGNRGCSNWAGLPSELLRLILSNLFLEDSSNFSATCRSWHSITPPFPPPTSSALSKLPYLMILNGGGDGCKFFQPLHNETYHDQKINDIIISENPLDGATIRLSKYGWLLISDDENAMFFFSPFMKMTIELPDMPHCSQFLTMSFSSPPTSSDCVVIGICWSFYSIEFCITRYGDDDWTTHTLQNNRRFIIYNASPPVFHNGKFYCLGDEGDVGILDVGNDSSSSFNWSIIPISKPLLGCPHFKQQRQRSFIVNCDGGMLVVFLTHEERRIRLLKLNVPEMIWHDVQSLGNKMLYLSNGASLLIDAVKEGMANKIYFPIFHGQNGVFYSLDTGKYHSVVGNYSTTSPFNLVEQLPSSCTWMEAFYDEDDYTTTTSFVQAFLWYSGLIRL